MSCLLIDIDGTVVTPRLPMPPQRELFGHRLLALMRDWAMERGGWSTSAATRAIRALMDTKTWWDWQDFLDVLGIDAAEFWPEADAAEARHLRPLCPGIPRVLERLADAGHRLLITSNNPHSGIAHKLRLAGIDEAQQQRWFEAFLGTDNIGAMKWDAIFWRRALKRIGGDGADAIVIGDTWHDDVLMPAAAGIHRCLFLGQRPVAPPPPMRVQGIGGWDEVPRLLTETSLPLALMS